MPIPMRVGLILVMKAAAASHWPLPMVDGLLEGELMSPILFRKCLSHGGLVTISVHA